MSAASPPAPARIRVLPPDLADQIAAGEVVERPASVVKELVENAIDAGARRIDVEIDGGGRRLIRVVDDGSGMSPEDARLALRRHATSKISSADDLWGLRTFGFRGEALPSIAAVSRLSLATRTREAAAGFRLAVEAGAETEAREIGMPPGTQVEVRDLFFNTPARGKFLKMEATEAGNVSEAVLRLALAHPEVHFRLRQAGRDLTLDLPPHRDLGERVRAGLARRGATLLHEADGTEEGHRVRAFLAGPEQASTTTRSTYLYVGGRFVRDRSLLHALALGYGPLLDKGRYPMAALFVDVPGADVDVNVHPQKLEVRFARAQEVYAAVRHVVGGAIARAPWLAAGDTARPIRAFTQPPADWRPPARAVAAAATSLPLRAREPELPYGEAAAATAPVAPADAPATAGIPFFATLSYIGQLHRTYLVCEGTAELILIDQHAAHERVAYGRLRAAHGRRELRRQRLLFPTPVDLDEPAAAVAERPGVLEALGFEVERTGPARISVHAVPEMLKDADPKPLLADVLGDLADDQHPEVEAIDRVLATMACHSVVRAGDVLGRPEALALLGQLDEVDLRSHCPHGRPVMLRMPLGEIERRFGRA
jgi:DNA mismatch repair protein MutL